MRGRSTQHTPISGSELAVEIIFANLQTGKAFRRRAECDGDTVASCNKFIATVLASCRFVRATSACVAVATWSLTGFYIDLN